MQLGAYKIASCKDPNLLTITVNELGRNRRIVPTLRLEVLRVEEGPRTPGCGSFVEIPTRGVPHAIGIIQARVIPLRQDIATEWG
jgi:hypothetical protein